SSAAPGRTGPSCSSGSSVLTLASSAAAHDVAIRLLALLAGAISQRRHAPRGHRVATGRGRALATAVRMVDGVHRGPAGLRSNAKVALAAGLADFHVLVV